MAFIFHFEKKFYDSDEEFCKDLLAKHNELCAALPNALQDFSVEVDASEDGVIMLYFDVNGEEIDVETECNIIEPFYELRSWLEKVIDPKYASITTFSECAEPPIFIIDAEQDGTRNFSIYQTDEEEFTLNIRCSTKQLVENLYSAIIDEALEVIADADYLEDWAKEAYDDEEFGEKTLKEWAALFLNDVRSPLIEEALGKHDEIDARCNEAITAIREPEEKELFSAGIKVAGVTVVGVKLSTKK